MTLTTFTIDARPGSAAIPVDGKPVEALSAVLQLGGPDTVLVPTIHQATSWTCERTRAGARVVSRPPPAATSARPTPAASP